MAKRAAAVKLVEVISNVSDGANDLISFEEPYTVRVTVEGTHDILFHAWNIEAVAEKAAAKKNSAAKKSDNIGSYVYRDEKGFLCIPCENFCAAIIEVGRFVPDPRSPRKSAMDLLKSALIPVTEFASLGVKEWDYVHRKRVRVQRQSITRERPAMRKGWKAVFELTVATPEYVNQQMLNGLITQAGRLIGLCDYRPSHGRFVITKYEVI